MSLIYLMRIDEIFESWAAQTKKSLILKIEMKDFSFNLWNQLIYLLKVDKSYNYSYNIIIFIPFSKTNESNVFDSICGAE